MDARELFRDIESANIYLERHVNDGSPSGWTRKRSTSAATNPFLGADRFPLLQFAVADVENTVLGTTNPLFADPINYAHPDSRRSSVLRTSGRTVVDSPLVVSPTSGGRTMRIRDGSASQSLGYLKLTYDVSRLGRVDRQLTLKHCQSSLEVASALKTSSDTGRLPRTLGIMLEESAIVTMLPFKDAVYEWGVIHREPTPYPYHRDTRQLIPAFSLFGADDRAPTDERLLIQLIELSGKDPRDYLLDLLTMIVDCYWSVVLSGAFHWECHAQNCLVEIDANYTVTRVVIKDMDSVDKDIPLAKLLGLPHEWPSAPYMCFDESIYFYSIRPSFIYDYKLGEYLLSPIVNLVAAKYALDERTFQDAIRDRVKRTYLPQLPPTYFPADGCWYDCDEAERRPGTQREYYAHPNPKYR
jgi:hypothetical protein